MRRLQCPLAHDVACAGQQLPAFEILLALPSRLASKIFWEREGGDILVVCCAGWRGADTDALSWNINVASGQLKHVHTVLDALRYARDNVATLGR
jgi:hypothetical protein